MPKAFSASVSEQQNITTVPIQNYGVATVLLPLPLKSVFSYRLLANYKKEPQVGVRVLVPFGKTKMYAGVITELIPATATDVSHLKAIEEVLDDFPVIPRQLFSLYTWMAAYYMCSEGDILKASLPSGLKMESETQVQASIFTTEQIPEEVTDKAYLLLEALTQAETLTLKEVADIVQLKNPQKLIQDLAVKGFLNLVQTVQPRVVAKTQKVYTISATYQPEEMLHKAFDMVAKAPRQEAVLMLIAEMFLHQQKISETDITAKIGNANTAIKALLSKGIIDVAEIEVDRIARQKTIVKQIDLNTHQQIALNNIRTSLVQNPGKPVLLMGVAGSGKTHIYIELMREQLALGRQVLYLLPEIGLTKQIIERIQQSLDIDLGVYHSRISESERVEIWQKVLTGKYACLIGVRSAMLLPWQDLGLIVVDEEHDSSFKQNEPSPRYNARDVALYYSGNIRGTNGSCNIVLGSATPALETYYNVLQNKYAVEELNQRARPTLAPAIEFIDMRTQIKAQLSFGLFSEPVVEALKETIAKKEQAIIFKNRRGYAPSLVCENCGTVPRCPNCDIALTYHKRENYLRCHHCGYTDTLVNRCAVCNHPDMRREGIGTERMEEQLQELLPNARIGRMDLDTTRGKKGFENVLTKFERQEYDILVGTQMVTKGLDFDNVTLGVVVSADQALNFPDIRAHETTFQILTQFAGRAGRHHKQGRVLIQTRQPEHPVLQMIGKPYTNFYAFEIAQRQSQLYPPFSRIIHLELRHADLKRLDRAANTLAKTLKPIFGDSMLGPEAPLLRRLRGLYRLVIQLKISRNQGWQELRTRLHEILNRYQDSETEAGVRLMIDVDPR